MVGINAMKRQQQADMDLLEAAKSALEIAEGWIHSELEGTDDLAVELARLKPIKQAIAREITARIRYEKHLKSTYGA